MVTQETRAMLIPLAPNDYHMHGTSNCHVIPNKHCMRTLIAKVKVLKVHKDTTVHPAELVAQPVQ
jgi:hypothetical protein